MVLGLDSRSMSSFAVSIVTHSTAPTVARGCIFGGRVTGTRRACVDIGG